LFFFQKQLSVVLHMKIQLGLSLIPSASLYPY